MARKDQTRQFNRRVWVSGISLAVAILCSTWAAIEILPRTKMGVEHVSLGLGLAFYLWWVYGKDTGHLRRRLQGRLHAGPRFFTTVVITAGAIALFFLWLRIYLAPERLLRDRLLSAAEFSSHIQGESPEERILSSDGHLPGWLISYYKAHDLRSQGLIVLDEQNGKDQISMIAGEPSQRPLLLLAQPAVRKRPFMLALRRTLAMAPYSVPSALITVRECYARGEHNIDACLRTELSNLFKGPDVWLQPSVEELSDAFESNRKWWLFVDGIDDAGSASDMVRLIREALRYAKNRGGRVLLSSRRSLLEYVLEKTISDDLASFLHDASVISVDGLDQAGFDRRKRELVSQPDPAGTRARRAFDELENQAVSDPDSKELILDIERTALVIDGIGQLDVELIDAQPSKLRRRGVIANWATTRQFESHCLGELCGNDERKAAIERTWRLVTSCLGEYSQKRGSIDLHELEDLIERVKGNREIGRDSVLYALLGTGLLEPHSRDTFIINKVWAASPESSLRLCEKSQ